MKTTTVLRKVIKKKTKIKLTRVFSDSRVNGKVGIKLVGVSLTEKQRKKIVKGMNKKGFYLTKYTPRKHFNNPYFNDWAGDRLTFIS